MPKTLNLSWIKAALVVAVCLTLSACSVFELFSQLVELYTRVPGSPLPTSRECDLSFGPACVTDRPQKPSGGTGGGPSAGGGAAELAGGLQINGEHLSIDQAALVDQRLNRHLADGAYWYDSQSGLFGPWKGPAMGMLGAGLDLGGELQADASAGGAGVFANGRELHRFEVAALRQVFPLEPGRYWLDPQGNAGHEGHTKVEFSLLELTRKSAGEVPEFP